MKNDKSLIDDPWQALRRFTAARIALGRTGGSLPTKALLEFQLAHARARDAVHTPLDTDTLATELRASRIESLVVDSAAQDRHHYLQRPDLGRCLADTSRLQLGEFASALQSNSAGVNQPDIVFVIADGLSALAIQRNAATFASQVLPLLSADHWYPAPVVIVRQGRVAIGDEIGAVLGVRAVVMLIGERPGLSSPDSMGIYLTWSPQPGITTDAGRNCISNVREGGQSYAEAAHRLNYLLGEARSRQLSGVALKDETDVAPLQIENDRNFLIAE